MLHQSRLPSIQSCRGRSAVWLDVLTSTNTRFFQSCSRCSGAGRDVTINYFCLHCADPAGFCSKCSHLHESHDILQVRRSSFIRVSDLQEVTDVSGIQTYMINSSRVIFVKQRPQPRPSTSAISCLCCNRQLQDSAKFCSLRCKLECGEGHEVASRSQPCSKQKRRMEQDDDSSQSQPLAAQAPDTPSNSEQGIDNYLSDPAMDAFLIRCYEPKASQKRRRKYVPCRSPLE
uniref:Platz transcription factor family protein isoform 1 n=2 Tax=Tetraselmis sp. GSL018 TaxID=582737 RepID=A0A061RGN5_9CHLO